ncbi:uncharacterized protein BXZ73DRAFT_78043 [Epithele typhae]|uniref:uncharacterized protein n=1 Tax=Epithele typhae TaxID=378194 RepID=UPI002008233C|nr:uncharacterized protein BXZ73DRAFT_78043 [Epithele typhae]KAH9929938.1 hypothetical protein BXZ73DRAFT_78043 [Epithele typhae]
MPRISAHSHVLIRRQHSSLLALSQKDAAPARATYSSRMTVGISHKRGDARRRATRVRIGEARGNHCNAAKISVRIRGVLGGFNARAEWELTKKVVRQADLRLGHLQTQGGILVQESNLQRPGAARATLSRRITRWDGVREGTGNGAPFRALADLCRLPASTSRTPQLRAPRNFAHPASLRVLPSLTVSRLRSSTLTPVEFAPELVSCQRRPGPRPHTSSSHPRRTRPHSPSPVPTPAHSTFARALTIPDILSTVIEASDPRRCTTGPLLSGPNRVAAPCREHIPTDAPRAYI